MRHRIVNVLAAGAAVVCLATGTATTASAAVGAAAGSRPSRPVTPDCSAPDCWAATEASSPIAVWSPTFSEGSASAERRHLVQR